MEKISPLSFAILVLFFIFIPMQRPLLFAKEKHKKASKEELLIAHVKNSIEYAEKNAHALNSSILYIEGMSNPKVRCLLNRLCSLPDTSYLEIGCWKGSTLIAALYKNEKSVVDAIAIDNWSEFGGPKAEFFSNVQTFIPNAHLRFYETDCFQIDQSKVFRRPVSLYFYDGDHTQLSQERAFTYFYPIFDDVFIAIVSDWNSPQVRQGTQKAFHLLGYQILYENNLDPAFASHSFWWNGLYIAVIKQKPCNCH